MRAWCARVYVYVSGGGGGYILHLQDWQLATVKGHDGTPRWCGEDGGLAKRLTVLLRRLSHEKEIGRRSVTQLIAAQSCIHARLIKEPLKEASLTSEACPRRGTDAPETPRDLPKTARNAGPGLPPLPQVIRMRR